MNDNYFLDSNIILYALGNDLSKKQQAQALINKQAVISTQVLSEVANVCLKKFLLPHDLVEQWINLLIQETRVEQVTSEIVLHAIKQSKSLQYSFYDSLIVATALNAKVEIFYSEDMQHNRQIENLKIVNPFKVKEMYV